MCDRSLHTFASLDRDPRDELSEGDDGAAAPSTSTSLSPSPLGMVFARGGRPAIGLFAALRAPPSRDALASRPRGGSAGLPGRLWRGSCGFSSKTSLSAEELPPPGRAPEGLQAAFVVARVLGRPGGISLVCWCREGSRTSASSPSRPRPAGAR